MIANVENCWHPLLYSKVIVLLGIVHASLFFMVKLLSFQLLSDLFPMKLQNLQPDMSIVFSLNAKHTHFTKRQSAMFGIFAFYDLTGKLLNIA